MFKKQFEISSCHLSIIFPTELYSNFLRLINESRYNKSDDDEPQLKKKRKEVSIFDSDDD